MRTRAADVVVAAGLLAQAGILAWAAAGLGRVGAVLAAEPRHGALAVAAWPAIAGVLAWIAYRRAAPPPERPRAAFRALRAHATGMAGLCGVALVVTLTVLTPLLTPWDPTAVDLAVASAPPSRAHPLGTDPFGRDLLARMLYGGRVSLTIGLVAVAIAATIGTTVGAVAGYAGGVVDRALMWLVDLLLALPGLLLLITVVGLFDAKGSGNVTVIVVVLGALGWMPVARVVRSQVLSLREREFVLAARALGVPGWRILSRHVVPNALAPVIVYASLAVGGIMLVEASLSFLGLGVAPPTPTWGMMVFEGRERLRSEPWVATLPGLAIALSVMSFNLLGEGLRDALDPRLR